MKETKGQNVEEIGEETAIEEGTTTEEAIEGITTEEIEEAIKTEIIVRGKSGKLTKRIHTSTREDKSKKCENPTLKRVSSSNVSCRRE